MVYVCISVRGASLNNDTDGWHISASEETVLVGIYFVEWITLYN